MQTNYNNIEINYEITKAKSNKKYDLDNIMYKPALNINIRFDYTNLNINEINTICEYTINEYLKNNNLENCKYTFSSQRYSCFGNMFLWNILQPIENK